MRRLVVPICLCLAALVAVAGARGDLVQKGNLRVAFDARLSPPELPRHRLAPITIGLDGAIRTVDGSAPPPLRRISIAINRNGRLFVGGLPQCSAAMLQQTTSQTALERCRAALIGRGRFVASVDFPDLPSVLAEGRTLLFHGRRRGRTTLFLHLHISSPVRATFVLPFTVAHRRRGDFGTVISTRIPKLASDLGYVTDLELRVGRQYRWRGESRSLLSASCAAPLGFDSTIFNFSRATFIFANAQRVTTTLTRNCRVRKG